MDISYYAKDGRLAGPSDGKRYRFREMFAYREKVGRPLAEEEAKQLSFPQRNGKKATRPPSEGKGADFLYPESPYREEASARAYLEKAVVDSILHYLWILDEESDSEILTDRYGEEVIRQGILETLQDIVEGAGRKAYALGMEGKPQKDCQVLSARDREIIKSFFWRMGFFRQILSIDVIAGEFVSHEDPWEVLLHPGMSDRLARQILSRQETDWDQMREDRFVRSRILELMLLVETKASLGRVDWPYDPHLPYVSRLNVRGKQDRQNGILIYREPEGKRIHLIMALYEDQLADEQLRLLEDPEYLSAVEKKYDGTIGERIVVYGEEKPAQSVGAADARTYLLSIGHVKSMEELLTRLQG